MATSKDSKDEAPATPAAPSKPEAPAAPVPSKPEAPVTKPQPPADKPSAPKGKEDRQAEQEDNVPWTHGFKDPDKAAPGDNAPLPGQGPTPEALDKERMRKIRDDEEAQRVQKQEIAKAQGK